MEMIEMIFIYYSATHIVRRDVRNSCHKDFCRTHIAKVLHDGNCP